jgi:WG containing repeat
MTENVALFPVFDGVRFGYMDRTGQVKIDFRFQEANCFCDGLALVRLPCKGDPEGVQAFIDESGEPVIGPGPPLNFSGRDDWLSMPELGSYSLWEYVDFSEGRALFWDNRLRKMGYVDKTGVLCIPVRFNDAQRFSEGLACVEKSAKRPFFIDRCGRTTAEIDCESASCVLKEGMARFCVRMPEGYRWGYINRDGCQAIPLDDRFRFAYQFSEGLACVVGLDDKCGFIDKCGHVVLPMTYDFASDFSNGNALTIRGSKGHIVDQSGAIIHSLRMDCSNLATGGVAEGVFYLASLFRDGLAWVKMDKKSAGYINHEGVFVWKSPNWPYPRDD